MYQELFPDKGTSKTEIFDEINELCAYDYRYAEGKILNSICTSPIDIAKESYLNFIETNLGDKRLFPGVARIEEKTIKMLGSLVGNPDCYGTIISGGTEANLLALYVARELFHKRKGKNVIPEVIAPKSAHFSIEKVCKLLNLKLVFTPLFDIQHAGAEEIEAAINENTAAIIATAGTSELGAVDNIPDISRIASKYQIYFHVDAASGGFLIPFARKLGYNLPELNFKTEGISSLTIDPHKFGLSVIPSGAILFNNKEHFEKIEFHSFFEGTSTHRCFLGTRSGASAVATYATIKHLGFKGYLEQTRYYFTIREYLRNLLLSKNLDFYLPPDLNIVTLKHRNVKEAVGYFENHRWIISQSKNYDCLRIVLANHITEESLESFFQLYQKSLEVVSLSCN